MNTNMTGLRCFSKIFASDESSLSIGRVNVGHWDQPEGFPRIDSHGYRLTRPLAGHRLSPGQTHPAFSLTASQPPDTAGQPEARPPTLMSYAYINHISTNQTRLYKESGKMCVTVQVNSAAVAITNDTCLQVKPDCCTPRIRVTVCLCVCRLLAHSSEQTAFYGWRDHI